MAVAQDCCDIFMAVDAAGCIAYSKEAVNRFLVFIQRMHLGINAYAAHHNKEVCSDLDRIERSLLKRIKELFSLSELLASF